MINKKVNCETFTDSKYIFLSKKSKQNIWTCVKQDKIIKTYKRKYKYTY